MHSVKLPFDLATLGVSGKVTATGLGTAEIEVKTLPQIPTLSMTVNGTPQTATAIDTFTVTKATPTVIEFADGLILTLTTSDNGYVAAFNGNTTNLVVDIVHH